MLRITRNETGDAITFRVEGKLVEPWVRELQQVAEDSLSTRRRICLDLASLSFADAAGAELLKDLLGRGATITACSNFVSELLNVEML